VQQIYATIEELIEASLSIGEFVGVSVVLTVNSINRLAFVAEMVCVSCEVRTEFLYIFRRISVFKGLNVMHCCSLESII
jgi:hypothetical protein